eukprot:364261-Chlamydomonas_euryale.AAC.7
MALLTLVRIPVALACARAAYPEPGLWCALAVPQQTESPLQGQAFRTSRDGACQSAAPHRRRLPLPLQAACRQQAAQQHSPPPAVEWHERLRRWLHEMPPRVGSGLGTH